MRILKTTSIILSVILLILFALPSLAEDAPKPFQLFMMFDEHDVQGISYVNAALSDLRLSSIDVDQDNTDCVLRSIIQHDLNTGEKTTPEYHYKINYIALECTPATESVSRRFQLDAMVIPLEERISSDDFHQQWTQKNPDKKLTYLHVASYGDMLVYSIIYFEDMRNIAI